MGSLSIREGFEMKQFMKDFAHGFGQGCLDLGWLAQEVVMWARVALAYIVSGILTIPAAITQLTLGFVLMVGLLATATKGGRIHGILQDTMVELAFIVGILMIPAGIAFHWIIPEDYIMMLYLRKTEEIKKEAVE